MNYKSIMRIIVDVGNYGGTVACAPLRLCWTCDVRTVSVRVFYHLITTLFRVVGLYLIHSDKQIYYFDSQ
ncbi:hypothetical protein V1478_017124 [Vespula squamosa]|uniref:Uncharacterized protein n=1 Tax=Vespula squamosa TaxID=30214 RepID=A0ABD1ZYI9_VESSQ